MANGMNHFLRACRLSSIFAFLCLSPAAAQDYPVLETPSRSDASFISPYYFGPNAFPIPDLIYKVNKDLRIEVAGDYFKGRRGDAVYDVAVKANIPLFSRRVNLSLWIPVVEWYRNTDRNMDVCHVAEENRGEARRGSLTGDAYASVDIQVFEEKRYAPDVVVRAAIKSAAGGGYALARYYDCPGYFFDVAVAKSFAISKPGGLRLRIAATSGFLCWQTDNGRQNDAIQFGAMLGLYARRWSLTETFGGYAGWESQSCNNSNLAHDRPMSLKTNFTYHIRNWEIFAVYQYGFTDYPYEQFRLGLACNIDLHVK